MGVEIADVIKAIKGATKAEAAFAFGVGGSPSAHVLLVDRTKTGEALLGQVKKQAGVKQSCHGSVSWDGSGAIFSCEKPVSGLDKLVEAWFKANHQSIKATVLAGKAAIEKAQEADEDEEEGQPGNVLFAPETIDKYIKKSKTRAMHFAFGLGSKENLLALHPLRDGEKLFRLIKAENSATRKSWGTAALDGALVTFTCEEKPIAGLKRFLRELFKGWKFPYRVAIMGPDGEVGDEEDEAPETTDTETTGAQTAGEETAEDEEEVHFDLRGIADLRQKLARIVPGLQAFAKTAPLQAKPIHDYYQACEKALAAGDIDEATLAYQRLEAIEAESADVTGVATHLHQELEKLLPALKPVVNSDPVRGKVVRETYAECDKALKAMKIDEGNRLLDILRRLGDVGGEGDAGGSILERWKAARGEWRDASDSVDTQITGLSRLLQEMGDEDLVAIGKFGLNAITGNFKVKLMAAMMELDRADEPGFAKAAPKALGLVQGFQQHLDSDPRVAAVDDNPFGLAMSVRDTLGKALSALETVLKAA